VGKTFISVADAMIYAAIRLKLTIYCSFVSLVPVVLYAILRSGLEMHLADSIKTLGFILLLLNLPIRIIRIRTFAQDKSSLRADEYFWIFVCLGVVIVMGFFNIVLGHVITIVGLALFVWNFCIYVRQVNLREFINIFLALIIGTWVGIRVWDGDFLHPLLLERLATDNRLHIDTIFHVSVIQMIKTYGIPSTGLNGLPFLHYHTATHFVMAYLSRTLAINAFRFNQLTYPIIFLPLFLKVLVGLRITWCEKYLNKRPVDFDIAFWILLAAGLSGIFPIYRILAKVGLEVPPLITSESFGLSMILTLILCIIVVSTFRYVSENRTFEIPTATILFLLLMLSVIGLTKNSTLYVLDTLAALYFFLFGLYRTKKGWIIYCFIAGISLACTIITIPQTVGGNPIELFHFFKNYVQLSLPVAIIVLFFWSLLLVSLCLFVVRNQRATIWLTPLPFIIPSVLVVSIVGSLPALVLRIDGGSAIFFLNFQMWFSLAFLLTLAPYISDSLGDYVRRGAKTRKLLIRTGTGLVFAATCSIVIFNFGRVGRTFMYHTLEDRAHICQALASQEYSFFEGIEKIRSYNDRLADCLNENEIYRTLANLQKLDSIPMSEKSTSILSLGDISNLTKVFPCYKYPFFFPALTGMALKNGFIFENCRTSNYGMADYTLRAIAARELTTRSQLNVILIDTDSGVVSIQRRSRSHL
jgi:hypothetical protein